MRKLARLLVRISLCLAGLLMGSGVPGHAQEGADDDPYVPGLVATYRDANGHVATRIDHQLAFHWPDAPPDMRLDGGEFRATWQGHVYVNAPGDHRFYLYGSGEVELKVAGKVVVAQRMLRSEWCESPALPLVADFIPLELSFCRADKEARLMVLWSGPRFGLEPIPPRLLFHPRERSPGAEFERGKLLSRALRCGQCHAGEQASTPAPALDRLAGNVSPAWLSRWLVANHPKPKQGAQPNAGEPASPRRMPGFGLSAAQAEAVTDWLLQPQSADLPSTPKDDKKPNAPKSKPDAKSGERLFLTLGCLACHTWRDLGASGWFGGGDLTYIADKRSPGYFSAWLSDPARLNREHRMPVFALTDVERTSLTIFLGEQKATESHAEFTSHSTAERRDQGKALVEQFHCASCHRVPGDKGNLPTRDKIAPRLGEASDWQRSCLGEPNMAKHRPGYRLEERNARALRVYYSGRQASVDGKPLSPDGRLLLAEANCLACHAREGTREANPLLPPLLADKLTAVAKRYSDLAVLVPALTPPALTSIGDKLTDQALVDVIARRGEPHRPYFQVRMPRFPLASEELQALTHQLVVEDQVPSRGTARQLDKDQQDRYVLAGGRLVSSDGFGCTSCHRVGSALPAQAPLNARGPSLSQLDRRVRREWFERWVRDPARIVPRMEMPSVQIPVTGVLNDKLDDQIAAVWHVLNQPGFEPPPPNPIRVLRQHGNDMAAPPVLVTDVVEHSGKPLLKPFLVGLANRHNVLLNLETGGLSLWTVGDTARQRTRGKAWFWEQGGAVVLEASPPREWGEAQPDVQLTLNGRELTAQPLGQFITEADAWQTTGPALDLEYRLKFAVPSERGADHSATVQVRRKFAPLVVAKANLASGFSQELSIAQVPAGVSVRIQVLSRRAAANAKLSSNGREIQLGDRFASRIVLQDPAGATFSVDRTTLSIAPGEKKQARAVLHYLSEVPIDRFPPSPPPAVRPGEPVEVGPGLVGHRLPLPADIMPTALTWRADGRLVFTSLKGQVFEAIDTDGDGSEDRLALLADGLPAPYGACAGPGYVDVSAKYALLRIHDAGRAGKRVESIASGWGYGLDYHDWAVGLPRNERGEYFLGIPCQQDKRAPSAARFHGNVLKLTPRTPTADDPRRFALAPVSAGHRFPMGLALDRDGELFVTDNQGNYKPFNELNHVRPGAHFGFINALDRARDAPPRSASAIDIPHPWTRSVNGICFLYTPKALRTRRGSDLFGPLEGHLVGCEYDTRRLVRMTLQRVGDTYQGAVYPLSIPPLDPARGFLGPLVCAVSPRGELYVGSIRDSGWGAGNNVGEIIRIRVEPDKLPCGIAEVWATRDGFVLDFLRPIDRVLAGRADSYSIESYRREATPAYGGPDRDRRTEKVTQVTVAADARRVTLRLAELRPGFVYEFHLKNLAPGGKEFHPAEAHYTLRVVPK